MNKVQNYVTIDGNSESSFETLAELFFQTKGYITASNKWFWYKEASKKQRGYQDIDIIAIKKDESVLIAVTSELDKDQTKNLPRFFNKAIEYLKSVSEYSWLTENLKKIIVYGIGSSPCVKQLKDEGFELIDQQEIINGLIEYLNNYHIKGLKFKSSAMEMLRMLKFGDLKTKKRNV